MSSKAARYRAKVKKEDPAKYAKLLEKNRQRNFAYRQALAKKWEEEPHTRAKTEAQEQKRQAKRDREAERYKQKKALQSRQTRNSLSEPSCPKTPKRRKDMDEDERRAHDSAMRKRQRDARSSQKKVADNMKRRRQRQKKKEDDLKKKLDQDKVLKETPARLPKTAYNLNYEFKSRTKELQLSHEQSQTALNVINPRTPKKRLAIARLQGQHPCRVRFQCHLDNMEDELGITVEDKGAEAELLEATNPTHELIKDFYHQETVSRHYLMRGILQNLVLPAS